MIVFVASVSDYDNLLFEDSKTNRLTVQTSLLLRALKRLRTGCVQSLGVRLTNVRSFWPSLPLRVVPQQDRSSRTKGISFLQVYRAHHGRHHARRRLRSLLWRPITLSSANGAGRQVPRNDARTSIICNVNRARAEVEGKFANLYEVGRAQAC